MPLPAFVAPLLGALGKVAEGVMKALPFVAAFFAGKKVAEAKVTENNLEAKVEVEKAGQEVKDELRETPVGDYIRKNDI